MANGGSAKTAFSVVRDSAIDAIGIPQHHRNISKKFVMLWAWKRSKTQIIWETRKLIRDGIHRLPVSWQTPGHGALGRTAPACKCRPQRQQQVFLQLEDVAIQGGWWMKPELHQPQWKGGQEQETAARVTALQAEAINQKAWKAQIQGNQEPTPLIPILIECQSLMQMLGWGAWRQLRVSAGKEPVGLKDSGAHV